MGALFPADLYPLYPMDSHPNEVSTLTGSEAHDFSRCKVCGGFAGAPDYELRNVNVHVCKSCGFHYADCLAPPLAEAESDESVSAAKIEKRLRAGLESNSERVSQEVGLVRQYVRPAGSDALRGLRVLDVGCGGGAFIGGLLEAGAVPHGIELDPVRAAVAHRRYGVPISKLPVEHEYWQESHSGAFDVVTLWDVLEHVNFPDRTLAAAARLLRPGGIVALDTPCRDAPFHKIGALTYKLSGGRWPTLLNVMYSHLPYGHKQIMSEQEVARFMETAGLDVELVRRVHELTFPVEYYLRKLFRNERVVRALAPLAKRMLRVRNKTIAVGRHRSRPGDGHGPPPATD